MKQRHRQRKLAARAPPSTRPLNQEGQDALWVTADNPFNSCRRPSVTSVSAAQPRPADTFYKALNSRLFTGCQSYRPFKSISASRESGVEGGQGGAEPERACWVFYVQQRGLDIRRRRARAHTHTQAAEKTKTTKHNTISRRGEKWQCRSWQINCRIKSADGQQKKREKKRKWRKNSDSSDWHRIKLALFSNGLRELLCSRAPLAAPLIAQQLHLD